MHKKGLFFILLLLLVMNSCNSKKEGDPYHYAVYRAIHNKDTATLYINSSAKRFYGQYELSYYKTGKDSGDVKGSITGDTLRGVFTYISYGGEWKRIPVALLKKEGRLLLGYGVIGTYMNIPIFMPEIPIQYDNAEFVFKEMQTP